MKERKKTVACDYDESKVEAPVSHISDKLIISSTFFLFSLLCLGSMHIICVTKQNCVEEMRF